MRNTHINSKQELDTQEVMQYAIAIIDKFGYQKKSEFNSTYIKLINLLTNFDFYSNKYKVLEHISITKEEIYSQNNILRAEWVIGYFANKEINPDSQFIATDRTMKEIALNMYSTSKDIVTICYMYELYCRIKKLGKYCLVA